MKITKITCKGKNKTVGEEFILCILCTTTYNMLSNHFRKIIHNRCGRDDLRNVTNKNFILFSFLDSITLAYVNFSVHVHYLQLQIHLLPKVMDVSFFVFVNLFSVLNPKITIIPLVSFWSIISIF